MFVSEVKLRVRYGETDRMGFAYYGNYAEYFEVARVEALREIGMNYKDLEDSGTILPVYEFNIKYSKPALYDDMLTIKTTITAIPQASIHFEYETYNQKNELLCKGETTLVFTDAKSGKPKRAPEDFVEKLKKYF